MVSVMIGLGPYVWAAIVAATLAILALLVCRWRGARSGIMVAAILVAGLLGAATGYFSWLLIAFSDV